MPRASVRACAQPPLHRCYFVVSFQGRSSLCHCSSLPGPGGPALPRGLGARAYPPCSSVLAGTRLGERTGRCGLSVPNTEQGGGETPRDAPGLEAAECGLGGAMAAPRRPRVRWPGAGTQPVETFVAGTPLLRAFGANTTAKLTERMGRRRAHRHEHSSGTPALTQPGLSPPRGTSREGGGPGTRFRWFWARGRGTINQSDQTPGFRSPLDDVPSPLPPPAVLRALWALIGCLPGLCAPGPVGGGGRGSPPGTV